MTNRPNLTVPLTVPTAHLAPVFVSVQALQDKNASVAWVSISRNGWDLPPDYAFEASGSAKREQGDRYDPVTGELLALARAFKRLARELESEGNKRVRAMAEQAATDRARVNKPKQPVVRRTREEWLRMQRDTAGISSDGSGGPGGGAVKSGNSKLGIELTGGRYLTVERGFIALNGPDNRTIRLARV